MNPSDFKTGRSTGRVDLLKRIHNVNELFVDVTSAAVTSALRISPLCAFGRTAGLPLPAVSTIRAYRDNFVSPVVYAHADRQKNQLIDQLIEHHQLTGEGAILATDAQFAHIGHCSSLAAVGFLDLNTEKMVHTEVVHKHDTSWRSPNMEPAGVQAGIEYLQQKGVVIGVIVMDKNPTVIHLLEHNYPHIRIAHDFHHEKRALNKAISTVAKKYRCAELREWEKPMTDFCWLITSQANGNEDYVEQQFRSMLEHVCGVHTNCTQHEVGYTPRRPYLPVDSAAMIELRKKLLSGRQLKAMRRCALFKHTSALESHHGMRAVKWCQKNTKMSEATYMLHSALADMDTNARTLEVATVHASPTVHDSSADKKCSSEYAKTRKVQHPASGTERERLRYEAKDRAFIKDIMYDSRIVAGIHNTRIGSGHVRKQTLKRTANYKAVSKAKKVTKHDRLERLRRATDARRPHVPYYLPAIL
jgi:hypothetical protein